MKTLTVRMADRDYDELARVAASRGTTLSELARDTLATLLSRGVDQEGRALGDAPDSLDAVTRHQLALLHRILAHVVGVEDSGVDEQELARAEVLEQGYVEEYSNEFFAIEPELSRRESDWVQDVLEMFENLESSFHALTATERTSLGEHAEHRVTFDGFDLNDRLESRLLGYTNYLIAQGRWEPLAKHLTRDRGNSHSPRYDVYDRMREVYLPIWKIKLREGAHTFDRSAHHFDVDEIGRIIAAAVHPSRR